MKRAKGITKVREYAWDRETEDGVRCGGGEGRDEKRRNVEIEAGEQVGGEEDIGGGGFRVVDKWSDEGGGGGTFRGYVITVDYRESVRKGGTWPGGRATLQQGKPAGGVGGKKRADDARYIYISYTLLAELHLFEQVNLLFCLEFARFKQEEKRSEGRDKSFSFSGLLYFVISGIFW